MSFVLFLIFSYKIVNLTFSISAQFKRKFGIDSFFLLDNTKLEVCEDISYLGITFDYNGSFIKAKNKFEQQAQKALYSAYRFLYTCRLTTKIV
jgi:hypothetical protein